MEHEEFYEEVRKRLADTEYRHATAYSKEFINKFVERLEETREEAESIAYDGKFIGDSTDYLNWGLALGFDVEAEGETYELCVFNWTWLYEAIGNKDEGEYEEVKEELIEAGWNESLIPAFE